MDNTNDKTPVDSRTETTNGNGATPIPQKSSSSVSSLGKKVLISSIALLAVGTIAGFSAKAVFADSDRKFPPLIERIIQKFGLDRSQVGQVVDQYKTDRRADMQTNFNDRLSQAVKDGKITEDQKNKIIAKMKELQDNKQDWQSLTPDERRTKMETQRQNLQKWATDNGIDMKFMMGGFGGFGGYGERGKGFGPKGQN